MAAPNFIKDIDRINDTLQKDSTLLSEEDSARLLTSAKGLVASLESTEDQALKIILGPTIRAGLMALVRIGVFKIFAKDRMTATEISLHTGSESSLVVRLMRAALVNGIFEEVGEDEYAQNALSRFFSDETFQYFLEGIALNDGHMPKLPDFLESTNFRNPVEPDNGLLQYANNTKLSTMDWFKANPKELEIINRLMVAMTMKWRTSDRSALSSLFPQNTTSDILIVDVGGGQGVAMEDLRIDRPDLKGQMIFQDLPEVIIGRENIAGVEAMGYDFFGPQPVKGADVYLFRHVLHDWPDEVNRKILLNIIAALAPHSRIVIQDQVVPTRWASILNVHGDINMMLVSGMERSQKQWEDLLESVGLQIIKIIPPQPHVKEIAFDSTIEAVLKEAV